MLDSLDCATQKWPIGPISVARPEFYPRDINPTHPKGTSFGAPAVKFLVRLDLNQILLFLDGCYIAPCDGFAMPIR